jgi:hypothetical protein
MPKSRRFCLAGVRALDLNEAVTFLALKIAFLTCLHRLVTQIKPN